MKWKSISVEFEGVSLGDKRLDRRLLMIAERLSEAPPDSFPSLVTSGAELEGMYRFLQNDAVEYSEIIKPHTEATADRCAEHDVVRVAHDSSSFGYSGQREGLGPIGNREGFVAHVALAVSKGEERAPLGALGMQTHVFEGNKQKLTMGQRRDRSKRKSSKEVLSRRWLDLVVKSEALIAGRSSCIHLMDREADDFALFLALIERGSRFVIRGSSARWTKPRGSGNVEDKLELAEVCAVRKVPLCPRAKTRRSKRGEREEREAELCIRASKVIIGRPPYSRARRCSFVELNAVQVFEPGPPDNEEAVDWVLYTTEPIATPEQVVAIVDHYRARWRIEEYFKCLKTGCSMEKRQLESYGGLVRALAVFVPIAWKLLALRSLSRMRDPPPAHALFDDVQLDVIRSLATDVKLTKKPTAKEAMLAIANIGGHIKANGDPGWIVLARGYSNFLKAEITWRAALAFATRKM